MSVWIGVLYCLLRIVDIVNCVDFFSVFMFIGGMIGCKLIYF